MPSAPMIWMHTCTGGAWPQVARVPRVPQLGSTTGTYLAAYIFLNTIKLYMLHNTRIKVSVDALLLW